MSLFLCAGRPTLGQQAVPPYTHQAWTTEQGLPVNSVLEVLQDRHGYIWLATFDGLVRFDGVRFSIFHVGNAEGMTTNRLLGLTQAQDGTLWIRTEDAGLLFYRDGRFGTIRGLPEGEVYCVYQDRQGALWVGEESGLYLYREGKLTRADRFPEKAMALYEDRAGVLWIGTPQGLYRSEGGRLLRFTVTDGLPGDFITRLHEDRHGALWIGTQSGLARYEQGAIEAFTTQNGLPHDYITDLTEDQNGALWIGTKGGLVRLYGTQLVTLEVLSGEHVMAVFADREGNLWMGTNGKGLHQLREALFTVYGAPEGLSGSAYAIEEGRDGSIWIGTSEGLYRFHHGVIEAVSLSAPVSIWSVNEDRAGNLWAGEQARGLFRLHHGVVVQHYGEAEGLSNGWVRAIYEDRQGRLWVGTYGGLFRYENGAFTRYTTSDGLSHDWVRCIYESRDGSLWLCTNGGGVSRLKDGVFTSYTKEDGLSSDKVRAVYEDEAGVIWIGTEGRGLNRLEHGHITVYTTAVGLFDDGIHQILEDDAGRLWMSTNRGIFWVRRSELNTFAEGALTSIRSVPYSERDGLRNREANGGFQPAGIRARDGRLWFPTVEGVAVIDPQRLGPNALPPPVVIEHLEVDRTVFRTEESIRLRPGQRDFEIQYTGLSYRAPERIRFRYRLKGYDRDWVEAGTRRTAYYTNVPPGRYTFHVGAANEDGLWNEQGASAAFEVAPYVYETAWFRLLCLLALGLAAAGAYRLRMRQVEMQRKALEGLIQERTRELREEKRKTEQQAQRLVELDQMKSRFFTNISHEFRTPLTLILGPLGDALAGRCGPVGEELGIRLSTMQRNAQRLLRLINQLLDLSRLEAGALTLDARPGDIVASTRQIFLGFAPLAERRSVDYTFTSSRERLVCRYDADKLEKVLVNLLSNAFKFTSSGGKIRVSVEERIDELMEGEEGSSIRPILHPSARRWVEISVRDSGVGIAPEALPHVFDRFYRADEAHTIPGTGIGLALAKELVELQGGRIEVESEPGFGSTFRVHLPVEANLDAEHDGQEHGGGDGAPARAGGFAMDPEMSQSEPAHAPKVEDAADRTTILIVDDHPDIRSYVRSHLEDRYRVVEAADGAEGLDRARRLLPDLIISDVMMPKMDGYALLRALKADAELGHVPVLLLTAKASTESRVEGLEAAADDYVVKPFDGQELAARVHSLLANRHRLRALFGRPAVPVPSPVGVPSADSVFLERVRLVVEEHMSDGAFGVEALARELGLSRSQLNRRLSALTGTTPNQLIRSMRLERGRQLLTQRAGNVSEVAYAVGFNSLAYFTASFHDHFGCTPSSVLESGSDVLENGA